MSLVSKWRVRCTTEAAYVETWAATKPTTCPNDSGHTIDAAATTQLAVVDLDEVQHGLVVEPLSPPSAPTVEAQGTGGSTSWGYKVTAFSSAGESLASSEGTISDGNATLSASNYNAVSWDAVADAVEYAVYRSTAGGTPSTTGELARTSGLELHDTGLSASGSEPSEDRSGAVVIGDGVGKSYAGKLLTIGESTSDYQTVTSLLNLIRISTGAVAAGFGTGLYVELEDDDDVLRSAATLHVLWDDPDTADPKAKFRVSLRDGALPLVSKFEVSEAGIWAPNMGAQLLERKTVTGSAVEEVEFTGLDGDEDRIYHLICMIKNADTVARTYYLRPNDVGGTDTDSSRIRWDGTDHDTSESTYLRICSASAGEWMLADVLLYAKSGQPRMMRAIEAYEESGDGRGAVHCGVWEDTSANITSLVINGSAAGTIAVGSELSLYRML